MNVSDEQTRSPWMDFAVPRAQALSQPTKADVLVVGSGMAGLSVAYELAARGRSVVVVDRGEIGSGMTARTTAHLASALDDGYAELIKTRGLDCALQLYQSVAAAIDRIETIQRDERIACDFARVDGYWMLAAQTPASVLDEEAAACAKIGLAAESCRQPTPLHAAGVTSSLRFRRQARFHPTKYLAGLADAIARRGGRLFAQTCIEAIEPGESEVVARTGAGYEIRASDVVVATNSPVNLRVAIHSKQAPYRTYAIAGELPRGTLGDALYWDTLDPYHYVRLQPLSDSHDLIIVGGEDHKSGEADDGEPRFLTLERWTRERLPQLGEVTHRWSGQVLEPVDYVGFIGKSPASEHVFLVSGDSGQGITNGAVAGILIADLITAGRSPWSEVYAPARKMAANIGQFISENITPLKNFAEYLTAGALAGADQLAPGEGRVLRDGLQKVAACRDRNGTLHLHSASCTHLGCVVHWNSLEQCWDCPCHGSQFAPDGTALNGPAVSPLAQWNRPGRLAAAE